MFKRSELLEKYTAKILFGWNNGKFEDKYLKLGTMEREREASFSRDRTLKWEYYYSMLKPLYFILIFFFDLFIFL